jgi:hypothetical protein
MRWLGFTLLMFGCNGNNMAQEWQLDRLRVLGAKATPAEAQPGQHVDFESLIFVPEGSTLSGVSWFSCLPSSANNFGCSFDPSALDALSSQFESLSEEDIITLFITLQSVGGDVASLPDEALYAPLKEAYYAGFSGFEPELMLGWTAPEDALEGLSEAEQKEGLSALTTISAIPDGTEDESEIEIAYKRFPVSLADTPNNNPELIHILTDETPLSNAEVFYASSEKTHTLDPVISDDSIELYSYLTPDGVEEQREEQPYFLWYAEGGSFNTNFSLYPYNDIEWTAPKAPFEGHIISVIRDRRGGMDWAIIKVIVED